MTDPAAPTHRGAHLRLDQLDELPADGYRPGRTLSLRVEFARQLRRRRTQVVAGILAVIPVVIALAFQLGGSGGSGRNTSAQESALVSIATHGAGNFALFTEFASVGFLLVVIVALFCGDTVASEASWSSLRYLLTIPVPRSRLLGQKLTVALLLSLAANALLPIWAYVVGGLFFGWAPTLSPLGGEYSVGETVVRMALVAGYASLQSLVVAALAFLIGVLVDAPLGAVGGATLLIVISNILDSITALGSWRELLPTHFQYSWLDALGQSIVWGDMIRGTGVALVYASVLFGFAWWHFGRKDIVS